jgi:hypothetical protein
MDHIEELSPHLPKCGSRSDRSCEAHDHHRLDGTGICAPISTNSSPKFIRFLLGYIDYFVSKAVLM